MVELRVEYIRDRGIAVAHHDAGSKRVVLFCHGFRGTAIGPNRLFVSAARRLEAAGISSLRFDQFGSGDSDGDFIDSSFDDWIATTRSLTADFLGKGYAVALLGQSMGAATVIAVGAELPDIAAVVAWVPDPNVEDFEFPDAGYLEEGGQRVQAAYWQEAHDARVAERLAKLKAPALIVQCTDDEYVDAANRQAISDNALPHHTVVTYPGYGHSNWTYAQAEEVLTNSVNFIIESFGAQSNT